MQRLIELFENPYLRAAGIILGGMVGARILAFIITRILGKMVLHSKTTVDDEALEVVRRPLITSMVLVAVFWAGHIIPLPDRALHYMTAALQTVAILVWARACFKLAHIILALLSRRARTKALIQPRTLPVFDIFGKVIVWSLAVYFVFLAWDIDLTAWLASAGIAGIAIGFAAKDTLANLFSGLFIVADAPYQVGDMIVLDNGLRGRVLSIGLRSTRMITPDDVEITVPNGIIGNGMIVNETGGPSISQRIGITVDAAYGSDIDLVHRTLAGATKDIPNVQSKPTPQVQFRGFGASGLTHRLHVWIDTPRAREQVIHELHTRVYKAFKVAGIEIPYSKHDVYIKESPGMAPIAPIKPALKAG